MSVTLSHGYKKPQAPDPGSVWMPEHEENIQQLNDHNHDGANSELISGTSLTRPTGTITAGAWTPVAGGFEQTVNTPASISEINQHFLKFVATAGIAPVGSVITPTIERVTATSYKLTVNDNTLAMTVYYL